MPIIHIHLLEGRSVEQKRAMVKAVTAAVVASVGAAPENIRIIINDMAPEHYAVGGVSVQEQKELK